MKPRLSGYLGLYKSRKIVIVYERPRRSTIETKDQILKKARKLFAKHGFDGVSVRNICEKATCNVSAISYHYGSKEELYRACLAEDGSNILQLIEHILVPPENLQDFKVKLRLFMVQFFEYNMNNRDLILMISKDVSSKMAMESVHKIFHKIPEKLTAFFESAKSSGIMKSDIDPDVLGSIILQPLFMQTLFAESGKTFKENKASDPAYRSHFIDQQLMIFFESIVR